MAEVVKNKIELFRIGICEPGDFSKKAIKELETIGSVSCYEDGDMSDFIADKDAIFIRLKYAIDDKLLEKAAKLKYICSPTTGLNHLKFTNDKIRIISLKGEYEFLDSIRATPEHVFGLTLGLLRNYSHAYLNSANSKFDRNPYKGYEIYGNKIGIIGLGRVGKIIAGYYRAFGAQVYYVDIADKSSDADKCGAIKCDSIAELIAKSNIIILAANYTPENARMIGSEQFSLMQGKYFINAARGELVDEEALLEYLRRDWFKGAAIDVIADETGSSEFLAEILKIADEKNLIITPHIGGATYSSMERTEEFIAGKLVKAVNDAVGR